MDWERARIYLAIAVVSAASFVVMFHLSRRLEGR